MVRDFFLGTKRRQGVVEQIAKQAVRTAGAQILRGLLGGILGGSGRSRRRS